MVNFVLIYNLIIMPRVKLYKKEDVLIKAMELFWKQGYHATSIQNLVQYLGINRASLYDSFGGKKALFEEALQHYRSYNINAMESFLAQKSNVKEGMKQLLGMGIKESVEDCDRKGCFVVNATTELIPGDDHMLKILEENKKVMEGIFYNFLLLGEQRGQIKEGKDLKTIASMLFSLHVGLRVMTKIEPEESVLQSSIDMALSLLD